MPRTIASRLAHLRAVSVPRLAVAVLLAAWATAWATGCATGSDPRDEVDASVKEPLPPDAAPQIEPYPTTLYVRGSFNRSGLSSPFTHEGNNRYSAVVSIGVGSHTLKIADEGFSADTTFAAAADRALAVELDTPTGLVQVAEADSDMLLFAPQTGAYHFELSATNRAAPVLLVSLASPAPYRELLYVRGSFNDFDTSAPLAYEGSNRYTATLALEAGTHGFKVADEFFSDNTTFSLSDTEAAPLALDTIATLVRAPGLDNDTQLELAEGGIYRFELIASNLEAPVLQVSLATLTRAGTPAGP